MKMPATISACIVLTACNADTPEPAQDTQITPPNAVVMAADGAPPQGLYRATDAQGSILIEELRADGTYSFSEEDGTIIDEGTYIQRSPAKLCFTGKSEDAVEKCYAEEIGEDGVWRTTDPDTGEVAVIERIEPEG